MSQIFVAGLQKQSLIDYPQKVACVVFIAGCNMRCHYCHNAQILDSGQNQMPFDEVLAYLRKNQKMLDAVVVSGGEPTLNENLFTILKSIRALNLLIKLDTNGTRPDVVRQCLENGLIDLVALDIKAPVEKYRALTGMDFAPVQETLAILKAQKHVPYLLRTTVSPRLDLTDIEKMGQSIIKGAPIWQIQQCRIAGAHAPEKIREIANLAKKYAQDVVVRGL